MSLSKQCIRQITDLKIIWDIPPKEPPPVFDQFSEKNLTHAIEVSQELYSAITNILQTGLLCPACGTVLIPIENFQHFCCMCKVNWRIESL